MPPARAQAAQGESGPVHHRCSAAALIGAIPKCLAGRKWPQISADAGELAAGGRAPPRKKPRPAAISRSPVEAPGSFGAASSAPRSPRRSRPPRRRRRPRPEPPSGATTPPRSPTDRPPWRPSQPNRPTPRAKRTPSEPHAASAQPNTAETPPPAPPLNPRIPYSLQSLKPARNPVRIRCAVYAATSGRGIYPVLWTGGDKIRRRSDGNHPATPDELRELLEGDLTPEQASKISVIVLDVTKPQIGPANRGWRSPGRRL